MKETKFKKTEAGMVPVDWNVWRISEHCSILGSNTFSRDQLDTSGSVMDIHYGDVLIKFGAVLDMQRENLPWIKPNFCATARIRLQDGDVVMADTAEDETVGKSSEIININNSQIDPGLHTMTIRPKEKFEPKFLGYYINSTHYHNQLLPLIQGTKVYSINKSAVEGTFILCPTPSEQKRIATVLSNVDDLIKSFDKLIVKKQAVKQGTMQQLLTGIIRLKGFTGPWLEKKLGDICDIKRGQNLQSNNFKSGTIPVIAGGKSIAGFHNVANFDRSTITVSASGANAGYVWYHDVSIFATDCSVIEDHESFCLGYIYYSLVLNQNLIYRFQTGGAQPHIHPKDLSPLLISLPSTLSEQRAITDILFNMDKEIKSLQAEKVKYIDIKSGMMQQLLTGKIRLI